MSGKRGRLKVVFDILNAISSNKNKIKPTPLLRYSNLSSQLFNRYIKELTEKKLLKVVNDAKGRKHFALTEKGYRYVEKYSSIVSFMNEFDM